MQDSLQRSDYSITGSGLGYPNGTFIPQMAILRTTRISIDEELGCVIGMSPPCYFQSARHYPQMNSGGALDVNT
ncbi:hypothetical protein HD806DRAFT_516397 [Xylariaceae sp. AK1471]|nr:hypothetical protein HD806DRAFT_516397 [Xylariaceae sp. AK1471]